MEDLHRHPNNGEYDDVGAQKPREVKGHQVWKRLTLALVGLLCVLLLAVIAGLFAKTTQERNQCQSDFSSLQTEKAMEVAELESNLTQERHQYNQLKLQNSQLHTSYNITAEEKDNLQARLCKLEKDVKQYAVDVTLDPDTAHPLLILSADGKQVRDNGTSRWDIPDNPKRFDRHLSVLGKQGFSSGRFYYEVQVKEKKGWTLGVIRGSSNRKGYFKANLEKGYWIIEQDDWNEFRALDDSSIPLKPLNELERVGVFVDYEAGLVSFYNADQWDLLYSFKHAHFNGSIYPIFNPYANNNGDNSSPLVIHTPVACQYHEYK